MKGIFLRIKPLLEKRHSRRRRRKKRTKRAVSVRRSLIYDDNLPKSKSARAYAKTYGPAILLVPAIVVDRVLADTGKI